MSNTVDDQAARPESGRAGRGKTALVSVLILLAGVALMVLIFKTEPTARRGDVARETAMLVEVRSAERGRFTPVIEVMGRVAEGTALLRIDPADYQAALRQRRSELAQARADLELEQGRQAVAEQDFELLGEELDEGNRHLVLRQPQLKQARARVDFAEAALRRAELDLQRTRISAPFDAQILSRDVATGSQVSTGDSLARLVATDRYWVSASVPLSQLRWLRFAEEDGEQGAPVTLRHEAAWGPSRSRQGRLQRLVGELDANARLARVLVSVEDPLALQSEAGAPSLILGAFVRTAIEGRALDDVVRLDRDLLRREDTVWVMEDGALDIRDVTVLLRDNDYVYLSDGLDQGDQVVATDLATVVDGAALRLEDAAGAETME